jgi:hypothetical protein
MKEKWLRHEKRKRRGEEEEGRRKWGGTAVWDSYTE